MLEVPHPDSFTPVCVHCFWGVSGTRELVTWWGRSLQKPLRKRTPSRWYLSFTRCSKNLPNWDGKGEVLFSKPACGPGGVMRRPSGAAALQQHCHSPPLASASASQCRCSPLNDFCGAGNSFIQGFQSAHCWCALNPSFFFLRFFSLLFSTQCVFLARAIMFCCVLREKRVSVFRHSMPLAVPSLWQGGCAWLLQHGKVDASSKTNNRNTPPGIKVSFWTKWHLTLNTTINSMKEIHWSA